MQTTKQRTCSVRWAVTKDLPEVLAIERQSFGPLAWREEDFRVILRQRNAIGMVAEEYSAPHHVAGFMVYMLHNNTLELMKLAVAEHMRHQCVGAAMVEKLANKLSQHKRTSIENWLPERNLRGQLFLRAMGFRAVETWRDINDEGDGYLFRLTLCVEPATGQNRITEHA